MLLHHGWPLLLLLLLILRMMQCLYKLLLLLQRRSTIITPSARRGTHAQRVLAVRQSNPILHNPAQRVARHFGKSFRRKVYVLKLRKETSTSYHRKRKKRQNTHLDETHRPVCLVPETKFAIARTRREDLAENILEVIGRVPIRRWRRRQISHIQGVDLDNKKKSGK